MARRRLRGLRRRACLRKRRYATAQGAHQALSGLVARGAESDRLEIYPCQYCGGWHVGHRPGSVGGRRT